MVYKTINLRYIMVYKPLIFVTLISINSIKIVIVGLLSNFYCNDYSVHYSNNFCLENI